MARNSQQTEQDSAAGDGTQEEFETGQPEDVSSDDLLVDAPEAAPVTDTPRPAGPVRRFPSSPGVSHR